MTPPWKPFSGSVIANTTTTSASGPLETNVFVPFSRQPAVGALGAHLHRKRVGTGIGLGSDGVGTHQRAVAQAAQISVLLRRAAVLPDGYDAREHMGADREHEAAVAAPEPERFERDRAPERIEIRAAVLLGSGQAQEAHRGALLPDVARESMRAVALDHVAVQLAAGELDDAVAEELLLARKLKSISAASLGIISAFPSAAISCISLGAISAFPSSADSRSCRSTSWGDSRTTGTCRESCRAAGSPSRSA